MGRFTLSVKVWWRGLRDPAFADAVGPLYEAKALPPPAEGPGKGPAKAIPGPVAAPAPARVEPQRNDALNLLAVLQREARLVDFLKESIAPYTNEQVGAAVRDVHRDAAAALERMFGLKPAMEQAEGASVEVPVGFDAGRIRLVGNVAGQPPYRGTVRHQGWEATKVQLPEWSGSEKAARVVAPAEVEL